jgi:hypothetical protein
MVRPVHAGTAPSLMATSPRVIVVLPDAAERACLADWLVAERFEPVVLPTTRAAIDDIRARPYDLLIADHHLVFREGLLANARARNPLTPAIVLCRGTDQPRSDTFDVQAMYLTRPVERATFMCYVLMALLEGRPVRRSVRRPVSRFNAFANGMPVHLLDVSREGLRLEAPLDQRTQLPTYFNVRVPLIGVAVSVKRMWNQPSAGPGRTTWYGGSLVENRPDAERAWRSFVETIPLVGRHDA